MSKNSVGIVFFAKKAGIGATKACVADAQLVPGERNDASSVAFWLGQLLNLFFFFLGLSTSTSGSREMP